MSRPSRTQPRLIQRRLIQRGRPAHRLCVVGTVAALAASAWLAPGTAEGATLLARAGGAGTRTSQRLTTPAERSRAARSGGYATAWLGWLNTVGGGLGARQPIGPLELSGEVGAGVGKQGASFGAGVALSTGGLPWLHPFIQLGGGQLHYRLGRSDPDGGPAPFRFVTIGGGLEVQTSYAGSFRVGLHHRRGSTRRGGVQVTDAATSLVIAVLRGGLFQRGRGVAEPNLGNR